MGDWLKQYGFDEKTRKNFVLAIVSMLVTAVIWLFIALQNAKDLHRTQLFELSEKYNANLIELTKSAQNIYVEVQVLKAENERLQKMINEKKRKR